MNEAADTIADGALDRDHRHRRPPGASDGAVEAAGKMSEAFEWIERARGYLYTFHQLMGRADFLMGDAADLLAGIGRDDLAALVTREVVGRNVLDGRWTFQIVEEFDETYYRVAGEVERRIRDELTDGRRHVYEAELKEQRRTRRHEGHEARPPATHDPNLSADATRQSA